MTAGSLYYLEDTYMYQNKFADVLGWCVAIYVYINNIHFIQYRASK